MHVKCTEETVNHFNCPSWVDLYEPDPTVEMPKALKKLKELTFFHAQLDAEWAPGKTWHLFSVHAVLLVFATESLLFL